jgi:hypothetical protein
MHKNTILLLASALLLASPITLLAGGNHEEAHAEKMVIALKTDDFEVTKTDISHLEVGDAETIITEDGKTIDLLRTADGVEVYVDGEMIDIGSGHGEGAHGEHRVIHKRVEVICEDDEADCEELAWIGEDEDFDLESLHEVGDHEKVIIIKKKVDSQ